MKDVIKLFRLSANRNEVLKYIIVSENPSAKRTRLLKFCENRWVEHLSALVFSENYVYES